MRKLTIIVNCTDRKSALPDPALRVRSLPSGDMESRFAAWDRSVTAATNRRRLLDLYQGEAWVQAKGLAADARAHGFEVRMLVASAGLGLNEVTQVAPPYAATFASGHADSVTDDLKQLPRWWSLLAGRPQSTSLAEHSDDSILMVLSENYARAMDQDLTELAACGGDHFLVGGWRHVDGLNRLAADRDLRESLGGTVSSLCLRMARRWLAERTGPNLWNKHDAAEWSDWAAITRKSENYQRRQTSDTEIVEIIESLVEHEPNLSATRALRQVRDSGIACEQKRFGSLFRDVAGAQ
ncbi:hypothetical protein ABFV47_07600 [Mycolicibacterium fortuitum]|uniref:hypothetical protein n=1 Tax=Mycolicibacterium fortuitum TaxID=1766 RepID=UPI001CDD3A48|nr:hypothetical protein [Mycolicibacterium fortuitum]UBV22719.1 hypothetical protein H8Z59_06005 [Mycolicibacterium fortuitum]